MAHHARIVLEFEPNAHYRSLPPVYGYEVVVKYERCWSLSWHTESAAIEGLLDGIARKYAQDNTELGEPLRVVSRVFMMNADPESIKVTSFGATAPTPDDAPEDEWLGEFARVLEEDVKRHVEESEWLAGVRQRAAA